MMTPLSLELAARMVDEALAEGERRQLAPLCIAVLDAGGHLLALKRDHRASLYRPQIAMAKASGCLGMGFGGRELARRAEKMPGFISSLNVIFPNGLLAVPGGVLIRDRSHHLLGAIGVSGDTSDNDELCALAAIGSVDLVPDSGI